MDFQRTVLAKEWQLSSVRVKRLKAKAERTVRKASLANMSRNKAGRGGKYDQRSRPETSHEVTGKLAVVIDPPENSKIQVECLDLQPHHTGCVNVTDRVERLSTTSTKRAWKDFEMRLRC